MIIFSYVIQDEIRLLKQKLKETEMNVSQDRYLKIKMNDVDGAQISQENAMLRQKISELQLQFEKVSYCMVNLDF